MNMKYIGLIVTFGLTVVATFFYLSDGTVNSKLENPVAIAPEFKSIATVKSIATKQEIPVIPVKPEPLQNVFIADKNYEDEWCSQHELNNDGQTEAVSVFRDFRETRGYYSSDGIGVQHYLDYPIASLIAMGNQGDQRALIALYEHPDTSPEQKHSAAHTSIIHGATRLAVYLGVEASGEAYRLYRRDKITEAKAALLEALAWNEYAAMRGDLHGLSNSIYRIERLRDAGKMDIPLSEDDLIIIADKAKQHYTDINRERMALGFDKLNDQLPKIVTQMNEYTVSSILHQGYNGEVGRSYLVESDCVKNNIKAFTQLASR